MFKFRPLLLALVLGAAAGMAHAQVAPPSPQVQPPAAPASQTPSPVPQVPAPKPATGQAAPTLAPQTVCTYPIPPPASLPPAGSAPVVYLVVPCFQKQGTTRYTTGADPAGGRLAGGGMGYVQTVWGASVGAAWPVAGLGAGTCGTGEGVWLAGAAGGWTCGEGGATWACAIPGAAPSTRASNSGRNLNIYAERGTKSLSATGRAPRRYAAGTPSDDFTGFKTPQASRRPSCA